MADMHKRTSQYINTPVKDFYLDVWEPVEISANINDKEIEIDSKYHQRPDLHSNDLFGTPRLWWVFAMRNKNILIDPLDDHKSGTRIFIPSSSIIKGLI